MKDKGQVIIVNCKRCDRKMPKWQSSSVCEVLNPFPFDSICGLCMPEEEVRRHYPATKSQTNRRSNMGARTTRHCEQGCSALNEHVKGEATHTPHYGKNGTKNDKTNRLSKPSNTGTVWAQA